MKEARSNMSPEAITQALRNCSLADGSVLPLVKTVPCVQLGSMRLYTEAEARRGKGRYDYFRNVHSKCAYIFLISSNVRCIVAGASG